MSYKLTINQEPAYLHVIVTGQNSRENTLGYLAETLREGKARNCSRVLVEERLEGPSLNTADAFLIVSEASSKTVGVFTAIAYVNVNGDRDLMHFVETLSVNRMLPVVVFPTVAKARKWLLDEAGKDVEPDAPLDAKKPRCSGEKITTQGSTES
jgi:hypothetical protein